jgi:hypothetical protein
MNFHEDRIAPRRYRCAGEMGDILPLASGRDTGASRKLDAMGGIKHHWVTQGLHDRQSPHIHHEVVVSKARPAFGN